MQKLANSIIKNHSRQQIKQLINLLSPQSPAGLMEAHQFAQLQDVMTRRQNGYSDKSIAIARLYFVEGASIGEAAKEHNVTYQCVYALIRRIETKLLKS